MWTTSAETTAGARIARRVLGYDIPGTTGDGNDPDGIYEKAMEFAEHIRSGKGPCLLECITGKWTDSVSNVGEVPEVLEQIKKPDNDCITRFEVKLRKEGILTDAVEKECKDRVQEMLQAALTFAQNSPKPNPTDGIHEVFS